MKSITPSLLTSLASCLILALGVGCTNIIKAPPGDVATYPSVERIPARLGLVVNQELKDARMEKKTSMGDKWVMPVGESVAHNAENLARNLFSEVHVAGSASELAGRSDAVLTPKVVYVNRTMGSTSFGESIVSVKTEWTLTDASGKLLWVDTITGESKGSTGWTDPTKVLGEALRDMFLKSHDAIETAAIGHWPRP